MLSDVGRLQSKLLRIEQEAQRVLDELRPSARPVDPPERKARAALQKILDITQEEEQHDA